MTLEQPVQVRLALQRRATRTLRRHAVRSVWRGAVLVAADLGAFWVLRGLLRGLRDGTLLGGAVADWVTAVVPVAHLSGWQFGAALFLGLAVTGNYGQGDRRRNPRRLLLGCALATALPLWALLWARGLPTGVAHYGVTVVLLWGALLVERLVLDRVIAWVRPPARHAVPTLFVGTAGDCRRVMESPAFGGGPDHRSVGFVDVASPPAGEALGSMREFPALLAASGAETVVACGYLSEAHFHELVDNALVGGCEVLSVPRTIEMAGVEPSVVWCQGQPLVQLTAPSFRGQQLVMKRVLDLAGALAGLLVFAPLGAVIALLIKLDSPGPVLFRQERVGRGGRLFRINKFRTMVDDAEARRDDLEAHSVYPDGRLFKIVRDPRTTRVGRLLRRTSLDELPQLLNVLRGEMSLVGPRPPLPAEVALYERHHYARFDATPGITGPWQVSGRSTMTDFNEIVRLETAYVRNWSMLSDFGILLRTIPAVFGMRGAH